MVIINFLGKEHEINSVIKYTKEIKIVLDYATTQNSSISSDAYWLKVYYSDDVGSIVFFFDSLKETYLLISFLRFIVLSNLPQKLPETIYECEKDIWEDIIEFSSIETIQKIIEKSDLSDYNYAMILRNKILEGIESAKMM